MESLEALFGLGLALPPAVVRQHMAGVAGMMTRCARCVCCRRGQGRCQARACCTAAPSALPMTHVCLRAHAYTHARTHAHTHTHCRYLDAMLGQLGPEAALIPPSPPLTRYKREVAVKQVRCGRGRLGTQPRGLDTAHAGMHACAQAATHPGTQARKQTSTTHKHNTTQHDTT
jgi:hypothetical protein